MHVTDLIAKHGISTYAIAQRLGRSHTRTAAVLTQRGAAWSTIEAIAAVLGVTADELAERATLDSRPALPYGRWRP